MSERVIMAETAQVIRHPNYPDIDLGEVKFSREDAERVLEQAQERIKAQVQVHIAIQSRAVTFAGILSALATATIGGLAALYVKVLEASINWISIKPLFTSGVLIFIIFVLAMGFAILVSLPTGIHIPGNYPSKTIEWLNYHSEGGREKVPILWDALNYEEMIEFNEVVSNKKARLLLISQCVAMSAFPLSGFVLLLLLITS